MNALHRLIEPVFFFFFLRSSNNFRFAFLSLEVASQALLEVFRSARQKSITFFAARLRTTDGGGATQLQLAEPKEQRVAHRDFVRRPESRS